MLRQQNVVGALVYEPPDPELGSLQARSTAELGEEETYTIALCGPEPLPPSSPSVMLTGLFVLDQWIDALNAHVDEQNRCRSRLEQVSALRTRLSEVEIERDRLLDGMAAHEAQLQAVWASWSWRLTAPLRRAFGEG